MARPTTPRLALAGSLLAVLAAAVGARLGVADRPTRAAAWSRPVVVSSDQQQRAAALPGADGVDALAPDDPDAPDPAPVPAASPAVPPPAPARGPVVRSDVAYGPEGLHRLDLRVPGGTAAPPLVVYLHGGGWVMGDKAGPEDLGVIDGLVARGFAVASVNYRLAPDAGPGQIVADVRAAVAWLRANGAADGIDTGRIALFGVSAGAQLASVVGLVEGGQRVGAVVDWQGPVDLGTIGPQLRADRRCGAVPDDPDDPASFWATFLGAPARDVPDAVTQADPRSHIGAAAVRPRFLVAHGDRDCVVPVAQSRLFFNALRAAGDTTSVLRIVSGAGHARQFPVGDELPVAADFLHETLGS